MKISVLIPVYNTAPYLRNCLDSCLSQAWDDMEIICVNDGSTDDSAEILRDFAEKDSRLCVVSQPNQGLPCARKTGIEHASGDYVFHLDSDDSLPPDALPMLAKLAEETGCDIVTGDYEVVDGACDEVIHSDIRQPLSGREYTRYILTRCLFNIWGKLISRRLYCEHHIELPGNISMAEDLVHVFQLSGVAKGIAALPPGYPVYRYSIRQTSMSRAASVGILADRSIDAVRYIVEYAQKQPWHPEIYEALQRYVQNFLYTYLQSPYPVSMRRDEYFYLLDYVRKNAMPCCFSSLAVKLSYSMPVAAKMMVRAVTRAKKRLSK